MIDPRKVEAYEKHGADLMVYAASLVGPQAAEDLVADAMVRIFRLADWGRVADERAYLYRCVLNEARRRGRPVPSPSPWDLRRRPGAGDGEPEIPDLGLLRSLSTRERAVVFLAYWEDTAIADIADTLAISDGAVRRYLARARAKLRKELGR